MDRLRNIMMLSLLVCLTLLPLDLYANLDLNRNAIQIVEPLKTDSTLHQKSYSYYYYLGVSNKNLGKLSEAYDLFQYCIDLDNQRGEAYYELGVLSMALKEYNKAIEYYSQAVNLVPDNYWYNESLFFALYSQPEKNKEAICQLEKMASVFPDKGVLKMQLMELYNQSKEYDKLVQLLESIESKIGKSEQLSMQKFTAYVEMGDEEKAFDEIKLLSKAYPNDTRYEIILANLYVKDGQYKKASHILNKILTKEPNNPLALFSLADYYEAVDDLEGYKKQVKKVVVNNRLDDDLRLNLMRQFIMKFEADSTAIIEVFETAMDNLIDDDQIPMLYAEYLVSLNRTEDMPRVLAHILKIDPSNTAARLMLLSLAVKNNNYQSVIEICEEGIVASPETLEFYYYLSIAENQAGNYNKVLEVVDRALTVVDDATPKEVLSDLYAIKGDVLHEIGDAKELYAVYDKALSYYEDNLGVLNNYAYYLSVEGVNLDKAEIMSKRTIDKDPKNAIFLDTYAWILYKQKKYSEAKIYILQAIESDNTSSPDLLDHAGDIFYQLGDEVEALNYWNKAYELDVDNVDIYNKIKNRKL